MILLRGVAGGNMTALIPHESKSTARGGARNLVSRALGVSANLEAARWFRLRGTRVQR